MTFRTCLAQEPVITVYEPTGLWERSESPVSISPSIRFDGPTSALDFWSESTLRHPFPAHAQLRALGPAVRLERHDLVALPRTDGALAAPWLDVVTDLARPFSETVIGDLLVRDPVWTDNHTQYGLERLPVRLVR